MIDISDLNNKIENSGATAQGKISASDWNRAINAIIESQNTLGEKADTGTVYTKDQANQLLANKANANDVYTKAETNNRLASKAESDDVHELYEELDTKISAKAQLNGDSSVSFDAQELTADLVRANDYTIVGNNGDVGVYYSDSQNAIVFSSGGSGTKLIVQDGKTIATQDYSYPKSTVDSMVGLKANIADVYNKSEVDELYDTLDDGLYTVNQTVAGMQATLNYKANKNGTPTEDFTADDLTVNSATLNDRSSGENVTLSYNEGNRRITITDSSIGNRVYINMSDSGSKTLATTEQLDGKANKNGSSSENFSAANLTANALIAVGTNNDCRFTYSSQNRAVVISDGGSGVTIPIVDGTSLVDNETFNNALAGKANSSQVYSREVVDDDKRWFSLRERYKCIEGGITTTTTYGATYDPTTGYYSLNGLTDITETEMAIIYNASHDYDPMARNAYFFYRRGLRTNILRTGNVQNSNIIAAVADWQFACYGCLNLEVFRAVGNNGNNETPTVNNGRGIVVGNATSAFKNCAALRIITGTLNLRWCTNTSDMFKGCAALETVHIYGLSLSLSLADSEALALECLLEMIKFSLATSNIAIELHYGVWNAAQADTDIRAALQGKPFVALQTTYDNETISIDKAIVDRNGYWENGSWVQHGTLNA